ncbi:MAG TPA: iron ABC transporter substrate-binding protein [Miltoncostaeaceae bacterium]|nr:iron ABC transporter substrate-binding protein [Miltoncostaeaceae bacterium]
MRVGTAGVLAAVVTAVGMVVAAGCGGDDRDALTIYTGRTESLVAPLLEEFSQENDVAIDVRYGDTNDLALLIGTEGDRSPADVYWGQSPGATAYLADRDLLAPLPGELLAKVQPTFEDDDGRWVGVSGRQRVLVYNAEMVDEADLPGSVLDLTAPEYRGKVGIAPSNGSFQDFVTAMRQLRGEDDAKAWLEGMAANDSPTYANNNAIVEAVGRGEIPFGLVNHYYNFRFLEEDPGLPSRNHQFDAGDIGGLVIPSSASVLASSDRQETAQRFIAFLLEKDAQEYFAEETFEYPLADGVTAADGVPPLGSLRPPPGEQPDELGDIATTGKLIAEAGLN